MLSKKIIPFKTFIHCTHFKVPTPSAPSKKGWGQTLQTLSTKVSTGLFMQQTLMKARNGRTTGVSKRSQIYPCLKAALSSMQSLKADATAFLQSKTVLQVPSTYTKVLTEKLPNLLGVNYFPLTNSSREGRHCIL